MPSVVHRLSKLKLSTFKVSYSPLYTTLIVNHIATNPQHPLSASQRRKQQERKKEGLWWNTTNGVDISKSGCVRTWARRRLRQAFLEELKAKGYDETGKLVRVAPMQDRPEVMNVLRRGQSIDLKGTLRIHGNPAVIPAKFEHVKAELRGIIEALVQGSVDTALGFMGEGQKTSGLGQISARATKLAPLQPRRQQEPRPLGQQERRPAKNNRLGQRSTHAGMRPQPQPRRQQERTPTVAATPDVAKPVPKDSNAPPVKAVFFARSESKEPEFATAKTTLEALLGHSQPSFISRRRSPFKAGETQHEETQHEETQHGMDRGESASSLPRVKPQAVSSEAVPRIQRVAFPDAASTTQRKGVSGGAPRNQRVVSSEAASRAPRAAIADTAPRTQRPSTFRRPRSSNSEGDTT